MTEENSTYDSGATPYDDVFRTLVVECSELVIPVLNEAFGETYTGNEAVVFRQNEHFLHRQDGQEEKRISDSSFQVVGETTKSYVIECQSTADSSMLIRIFEYVMLSALDDCRILEDQMDAYIPNAAILFLRSTKTTPDAMTITLHRDCPKTKFFSENKNFIPFLSPISLKSGRFYPKTDRFYPALWGF